MTVFLAVVEEAGFAAAARRLRLSPPAVTRAVAMLEEHLGVQLLVRTTRQVRLTEAGARYLDDVRRILSDLNEAEEAVAGQNGSPRGHLAITAPVLFGRIYVVPVITAYQSMHLQTTVSTLFLDRVVNLLEEGIDVGIRIGDLPDSSLRAIPVGQVRHVICAAPAYLERQGTPRTPQDLVHHTVIAATSVSPGLEWTFGSGRDKRGVRVNPRLLVNTNDGALEAARSGFGLTRLISYQIAGELASGALKVVLTDFQTPALPVHVIHHEGHRGSAKVRSFIDLAVGMLRTHSGLQ